MLSEALEEALRKCAFIFMFMGPEFICCILKIEKLKKYEVETAHHLIYFILANVSYQGLDPKRCCKIDLSGHERIKIIRKEHIFITYNLFFHILSYIFATTS